MSRILSMTAGAGGRARHHGAHGMGDAGAHAGRRVGQRALHDGGAAVVGDAFVADQVEHGLGIELAQAHVHAGARGDSPREAPAVAMEQRQRPQIHRVLGHVPFKDVADRVHVGAAIVIHHALGVAGGARRVVQRDGVPFVGGRLPVVGGRRGGQEGLVVRGAGQRGGRAFQVVDGDDRQMRKLGAGPLGQVGVFGVDDERAGFSVAQHEQYAGCVQAGIERVEHGTQHRHAENALLPWPECWGSITATVSPRRMPACARAPASRWARS